jgi:hypothetical protein
MLRGEIECRREVLPPVEPPERGSVLVIVVAREDAAVAERRKHEIPVVEVVVRVLRRRADRRDRRIGGLARRAQVAPTRAAAVEQDHRLVRAAIDVEGCKFGAQVTDRTRARIERDAHDAVAVHFVRDHGLAPIVVDAERIELRDRRRRESTAAAVAAALGTFLRRAASVEQESQRGGVMHTK